MMADSPDFRPAGREIVQRYRVEPAMDAYTQERRLLRIDTVLGRTSAAGVAAWP